MVKKIIRNKAIIPILLIITCTFFTTAGQFFWKIGSKNINSPADMFFNIYVWIGFLFYGVASVLLIISLRKTQLSIAYPILATGYIWAMLIAHFILKEDIYAKKIIGVGIIMAGVVLLGISGGKK